MSSSKLVKVMFKEHKIHRQIGIYIKRVIQNLIPSNNTSEHLASPRTYGFD